jgi:hypothetical protein
MHYLHRRRKQYLTNFCLDSSMVVYHSFNEMNPAKTRYVPPPTKK